MPSPVLGGDPPDWTAELLPLKRDKAGPRAGHPPHHSSRSVSLRSYGTGYGGQIFTRSQALSVVVPSWPRIAPPGYCVLWIVARNCPGQRAIWEMTLPGTI